MAKATHLECSLCGARYDAASVANLCTCGGPLLVRYDLAVIRHRWPRREVANGPANMWRYAPVLPPSEASVVTLGEGWTPLVRTRRLGARIGAEQLWVKDEGLNPTASFKARGLSCAVSMCVELGIRKVAIPSAGILTFPKGRLESSVDRSRGRAVIMGVGSGRARVADLAFQVFNRALHPEWFSTKVYRRIPQTKWEADIRIIARPTR